MTAAAALRCHYADQPTARPHCQLTAIVRYGRAALCADCDQRRSTVGKGQTPRRLPEAGLPIDPLDWIAQAAAEARAAEQMLAAAVHRARQRGHSWALIGQRLHITRQAAQQRFKEATMT